MEKFNLAKMLREVEEDGKVTRKIDHRLSRAGLKKLVAEKRKGGKQNGPSK